MYVRWYRFAHRRAARFAVSLTLLFVVALVLGGSLSSGLGARLSDYLDPGSASSHAEQLVAKLTGTDLQQGYAILVPTDGGLPRNGPLPALVADAVSVLRSRPEVRSVMDYRSQPDLVAANGRSTLVVASLSPVSSEVADVDALRRAIDRYPALERAATLGGPTVADVQDTQVASADLGKAEMFGLPVLLLLLLLVFRGFIAAVLPLAGGIFSVVVSLLVLAGVNALHPLSVFALNLEFALGLGLSIDFSLLMVTRFRDEVAAGRTIEAALEATIARTGRTITFSAMTVTVALLSLLVFPERFLSSMAIAGAVVTVVAAAFAVGVLPQLLRKFAMRLLRRPVGRRSATPGAQAGGAEPATGWGRVASVVQRHPALWGSGAAAVLLVALVPAFSVHFTGVDETMLPASSSAHELGKQLEKHYAGVSTTPIYVVAGTSAGPQLSGYRSELQRLPGVTSVSQPVPMGQDHALLEVSTASTALTSGSQRVLSEVRGAPAHFPVSEAGATADFVSLEASLRSGLPYAAGMIALATVLLLYAMTGSLVLPVKALLMNLLTLGATFGVLVAVFQWGWLTGLLGVPKQGGLESTSPLIMCSLVFGLSTDYGVFILDRVYELHKQGVSTKRAVVLAISRTGRVVSFAALLFCVAIGTLALSRMAYGKELAIGTAFAVVVDATVVRLVLVPALMSLLGDWNWWAPGFLARLRLRVAGLAVISIEGVRSEGAPPVSAGPAPVGAGRAPGK